MRLIIPEYAKNYNLLPIKTNNEALELGLEFGKDSREDDYLICWGSNPYTPNYGTKYGVMETGFFHNASFIDTVGNYQSLSLNTSMGFKSVEDFELDGKKSAKEIIFGMKANQQSKFNPAFNEVNVDEWKGPILILQNPTDRAILSVTNKKRYLQFVHDACKFYGKDLFVKFHPWNSNEKYEELENIVKPFGCKYGKAKMSIIEKSEFCLAYNSTFAIDAMLRDIPYVQYGMGTFFNAYGVIYTEEQFPTNITPITDAHKLPNFLIHKFCFNKNMDKYLFAKMIKHYANSKKMFPMIDEFSYANNLPI